MIEPSLVKVPGQKVLPLIEMTRSSSVQKTSEEFENQSATANGCFMWLQDKIPNLPNMESLHLGLQSHPSITPPVQLQCHTTGVSHQ